MLTGTGTYIAEQRRARSLNSHELARALGYTNVVKGARRILALERDGITVPGLPTRSIAVLKLDADHVHALVAEDRREPGRLESLGGRAGSAGVAGQDDPCGMGQNRFADWTDARGHRRLRQQPSRRTAADPCAHPVAARGSSVLSDGKTRCA